MSPTIEELEAKYGPLVAAARPGPVVPVRTTATEPRESRFGFMDGAAFILDPPKGHHNVWGDGLESLWSEGQALVIAGSTGAGKTTLAAQLAMCRIGLDTELLGFPVAPGGRRTLYFASDRADQASRVFGRLVTEADRDVLRDRLQFLRGSPPLTLAKDPDLLLEMCAEADADTVMLDSLKDMSLGVIDEVLVSGVFRGIQRVLNEGIQVLVLAHLVKTDKRPTINSVYGSVNIINSAGSVLLVDGAPGSTTVDITHEKPPVVAVAPMRVIHDHATGRSRLAPRVAGTTTLDVQAFVSANPGATAEDVADGMSMSLSTARRRLKDAAKAGLIEPNAGRTGGPGGSSSVTYWPPDAT